MKKRIAAFVMISVLPYCGFGQAVSVARLLHKTPGKAWELYNRGSKLYVEGSIQRGAEELERAVALDPGFPEAHSNLGVIYMVRNRPEAAAQEFRMAAELDPTVALYHCNLGVAMVVLGRAGDGEAEARTAISLDSTYARAYFLLGLLLADRPSAREAAERYLGYASRQLPEAREALERLHRGEVALLPVHEP